MTEESHPHEYPKIEGRLKGTFELQSYLKTKIHLKMNELYTNSNVRNPVVSSQIQKLIIDLFIEEYYPLVSRNIKTDNHTMAVIMGGSAYNMNIPIKMKKILYTPTDDIDMKIYTTDINSISKQPAKLNHVLSIFKYIMVIICLYMKQSLTEIIEYSRNAFEPMEPYVKHTMKKIYNQSIKFNTTKAYEKTQKTKKTNVQNGGEYHKAAHSHLIKLKQRRFGVLKSFKIKIQIKKGIDKGNDKGNEKEIIDITDLTYEDTYKLIMSKLEDPDTMITTKISYSFKYINLIIPFNNNNLKTLTFSDVKIIYPNIQNPSFFSYYFMYNKNKQINTNITLESLLKQNINISEIIDTKHCKNNCRFISVKCLQIDIIFMLRFAELLSSEDLSKGIIIVPVESLYKYYKYMMKFIRLHIIKKFFSGTLVNNKNFIDSARKLLKYVENNLNKTTSQFGETLPINIIYKNIISEFHQAFFIKKTMFPEYNDLRELVDDYNNTIIYINKSCVLFKKLNDNKKNNEATIDSISINFAEKQIEDENMKIGDEHMSGGAKTKLILHSNYSFDDTELDNHKYLPKEHKIIIDKLHKILKTEINFLGKLSYSIKK